MSRLEELIAELCPDGVPYVPLSSVCVRQKGIPITAGQMKELHNPDGEVCVFAGGNTKSFMNVRDIPRNAVIRKPSIIVKSRGNIGFEYYDKPFMHKNELWSYSQKSDNINLKFIYYYLDSHKNEFQLKAKAGKLPQISTPDTDNYKIPLPPLVIQDEIVRILDSFIELTTELTTELTKRKEQYQYYQDRVFNNSQWKFEKLGNICYVQNGGTPKKSNNIFWNNGNIKWLGSSVCKNKKNIEEITGYITKEGLTKSAAKLQKKGTTLIALVGATIGKVAFLPFEAAINQNIAGIYPKNPEKLNPSYLFFACRRLYEEFIKLANDKFAMASLSFVRNLEIPVPPLKEQDRIVAILDRFDALCNDLTSGLPAEIEARKKQYEYYRDKLLTFKEAVQ